MKKGVFITLEGGEGTGKSTQLKLLQRALDATGVDVLTTREPGGTDQAERIRNLLLQRNSGQFDPMTEALLLFAARREHLVNKIWPAIENGQWVIADRFADSSRAFQGYGMGLDMRVIDDLYRMVAGNFEPDLTLVFDFDPEKGVKRSMQRSLWEGTTEDRYERMEDGFHERVREGFLAIAKKFPQRCVIISASQDIQTIHRQILQVIENRFSVSCKEAQNG